MRIRVRERVRMALLRMLAALQWRLMKSPFDEMDDDDIANLEAWSISCNLAAVPNRCCEQLPEGVACLIRQAKGLHPEMAAGVAEREARGEPWPFDPSWRPDGFGHEHSVQGLPWGSDSTGPRLEQERSEPAVKAQTFAAVHNGAPR